MTCRVDVAGMRGSRLQMRLHRGACSIHLRATFRDHSPQSVVLVTVAVMLCAFFGTGCGHSDTDQNSALVSDLKIEIPESATNISADRGAMSNDLHFLLPNDEWRRYLATYYPNNTPAQNPFVEPHDNAPAPCFPTQDDGAALVAWTISDDIQFRNTNKHARRVITLIPDCQPGKTYVKWSLSRPR